MLVLFFLMKQLKHTILLSMEQDNYLNMMNVFRIGYPIREVVLRPEVPTSLKLLLNQIGII